MPRVIKRNRELRRHRGLYDCVYAGKCQEPGDSDGPAPPQQVIKHVFGLERKPICQVPDAGRIRFTVCFFSTTVIGKCRRAISKIDLDSTNSVIASGGTNDGLSWPSNFFCPRYRARPDADAFLQLIARFVPPYKYTCLARCIFFLRYYDVRQKGDEIVYDRFRVFRDRKYQAFWCMFLSGGVDLTGAEQLMRKSHICPQGFDQQTHLLSRSCSGDHARR